MGDLIPEELDRPVSVPIPVSHDHVLYTGRQVCQGSGRRKISLMRASGMRKEMLILGCILFLRFICFYFMSQSFCCMHVWVPHICLVTTGARREHCNLWNLNNRCLRATKEVLGTPRGSSAKEAESPELISCMCRKRPLFKTPVLQEEAEDRLQASTPSIGHSWCLFTSPKESPCCPLLWLCPQEG